MPDPITKVNVGTDQSPDIRKIQDERLNTATTQTPGIVKPDGQSITIDNDGTIHGAASPFIKDSSGYINFNY